MSTGIKDFTKEKEQMTKEVTVFDERIQQLVNRLLDTLHETESVGLSAPQIGANERIAIIDFRDDREPLVLINPVLVRYYGSETEMEGCLSYPDIYGTVTRPEAIIVEAQEVDGSVFEITAEGMEARAILHEMDHLVGASFIDKLEERIDPDYFYEEE